MIDSMAHIVTTQSGSVYEVDGNCFRVLEPTPGDWIEVEVPLAPRKGLPLMLYYMDNGSVSLRTTSRVVSIV